MSAMKKPGFWRFWNSGGESRVRETTSVVRFTFPYLPTPLSLPQPVGNPQLARPVFCPC